MQSICTEVYNLAVLPCSDSVRRDSLSLVQFWNPSSDQTPSSSLWPHGRAHRYHWTTEGAGKTRRAPRCRVSSGPWTPLPPLFSPEACLSTTYDPAISSRRLKTAGPDRYVCSFSVCVSHCGRSAPTRRYRLVVAQRTKLRLARQDGTAGPQTKKRPAGPDCQHTIGWLSDLSKKSSKKNVVKFVGEGVAQ